jgi:cobalt-zinc-cadmium efflux system outer membrane protein
MHPVVKYFLFLLLFVSGIDAAPLTFDMAVARVMQGSPVLRASNWEIQENYGRFMQSTLYPNPYFSFSADGGGNNNPGVFNQGTEYEYTLSQLFELGGKRCYRMKISKYDYYASLAGFHRTRTQLMNQLLKAIVEVAATQELVKIAQEQQKIGEEILQVVRDKVEAGKVSLLELNKSTIALGRAQIAYYRAYTNLKVAKENLSTLWGCPCPDFDEVSFPFFEVGCPAPLEQCWTSLGNNPELIQAQYIYLSSCQNLNYEKAVTVPDVTITAGYESEPNGSDAGFVLGIGFPIPLFDQNQGNLFTARSQIRRIYNDYLQTQLLLQNKLNTSHQELVEAYQEVVKLKSTILRSAEESFEFASEGYKEGKFDYLNMLDSQRTLFDVQETYIDALLTFHQKCADIEYLTSQVN